MVHDIKTVRKKKEEWYAKKEKEKETMPCSCNQRT